MLLSHLCQFTLPQAMGGLFSLLAQTASPSQPVSDAITSAEFVESLRQIYEESLGVSVQWNNIWQGIFTNQLLSVSVGNNASVSGPQALWLYPALCQIGIVTAVGTLLFFMSQFARDLNEGNLSRSLPELIWPFLVAVLLSPTFNVGISFPILDSGLLNAFCPNAVATITSKPAIDISGSRNNLARITLYMRQVLELGNQAVLSLPYIVDAKPICQLQQQVQAIVNAPTIIQGYVKPCFSDSGKSPNCLPTRIQQSINLLKAYEQVYGETNWVNARLQDLEEVRDGITRNEMRDLLTPGGKYSWIVGGSTSRSEKQETQLNFYLGFRQMLEVALLLTALAGPVAVGTSLLPVPTANKAILSWVTGLVTVGSAKMFYTIITGVTASVLLNTNPTPVDATWFSTFLNFVAPVLALGLATGGGVALWSGLQSGASQLNFR